MMPNKTEIPHTDSAPRAAPSPKVPSAARHQLVEVKEDGGMAGGCLSLMRLINASWPEVPEFLGADPI